MGNCSLNRFACIGTREHIVVVGELDTRSQEPDPEHTVAMDGKKPGRHITIAREEDPRLGAGSVASPPCPPPCGRVKRRRTIVNGEQLGPFVAELVETASVKRDFDHYRVIRTGKP